MIKYHLSTILLYHIGHLDLFTTVTDKWKQGLLNLVFLSRSTISPEGQDHRNNRHRMRAPIFSQSKICLHKMAHSKGHFYSVQTPVARNFARFRGVRLFFSNTVFLKSLKTRLD